jgi:hypothetical protein
MKIGNQIPFWINFEGKKAISLPIFSSVFKNLSLLLSFDALFWQNWLFSYPVCGGGGLYG